MNWLEKYCPEDLDQFFQCKKAVLQAEKWLKEYKIDSSNSKKALLLIGDTGIGKTILANILFKKFNYKKIELNSTDVRSQKKIEDFLKKTLTFKNVVDMFNNGTTPSGILLDEIDTICKLSDKGGFNEFLDILKENQKYELYKKKEPSKTKRPKKVYDKSNYIKLINPIICTTNDISDKKIQELKKYSEVVYFEKPSENEIIQIIDYIYIFKNNQQIDLDSKKEIYNFCNGDIRILIQFLESLFFYANCKPVDLILLKKFMDIFEQKENNIQLFESTKDLFTKKISCKDCDKYFDIDCLLMPLMMYHNSFDYIKNCEEPVIAKVECYKNILESLSIHDTIQTNIFEVQDWNELYDYACFYGTYVPNYHLNKITNKKEISIEFTNLLNKMSQLFVNKKMINNAKNSSGKMHFDIDEIQYITEILSYYFNDYKEKYFDIDTEKKKGKKKGKKDDSDDEDDNEDDNEDDDNDNDNDNSDNDEDKDNNNDEDKDKDKDKNAFKKKKELIKVSRVIKKNIHNIPLVDFMNKYRITIDDLDIILKLEKFNRKIEKRKKKRFTIKLKKDLESYLFHI